MTREADVNDGRLCAVVVRAESPRNEFDLMRDELVEPSRSHSRWGEEERSSCCVSRA